MKIGLKLVNLSDLREMLVGDARGLRTAFKCALGEAVHFWRNTFARYHFEEDAYSRYSGVQTRAKYSNMRPVDPNQVNGTQNRKFEVIFKQRTGLSWASHKMRKQFWKKMKMDNRPMVFTGNTRKGILEGKFTVRGTANAVRGSWSDARISWYGLSRTNWGERFTLGDGLTYANNAEIEELYKQITNRFFPYYLNMVNSKQKLPPLSALPMAQ